MRTIHAVSSLVISSLAAIGLLALTGTTHATPLGQPGSVEPKAGAVTEKAAWQCFQFGNCVWRPDAYFLPHPTYGYRYEAPPPRRVYRKRTYR
jgi:hypothetical protein